MTEPVRVAAVDLGATSGRVMSGRISGRPRRDQRAAPLPQRGGDGARVALLGRPRHPSRDARGHPRGGPDRTAARHRHRLVGDRLRPARPRRPAAGPGLQPPRQPHRRRRGEGRRRGRRERAVRHHRHPAAPVQHALPAGRGPRHRRARGGRDPAAAAGPARLLADRCGRRGAHQRLDHPAVRRRSRRTWAVDLCRAARACRRGPAAAAGSRAAARPAAARRGARPGRRCRRTGRRGRIARHRLGGRRRPARRPTTSPTSPRAPGRWSAWSSTRRC